MGSFQLSLSRFAINFLWFHTSWIMHERGNWIRFIKGQWNGEKLAHNLSLCAFTVVTVLLFLFDFIHFISLSFLVAFPRRQHNCTLLHFTLSDKAAFFIIINWRFFLFYSCSAAFFTLSWWCECWISHLTLWHFDLASPSAYKKLQNWFMQRILIEKFPRFACAAQLINGELFKWKLMSNESRWCDFFHGLFLF